MRAVLVFAALVLVSGCGASSLQIASTTAVVAMHLESAAQTAYLAHLDANLGECDGDAACQAAVNAAHAPAEAAIDLARTAILAYADGVALALAADTGEDMVAAVVRLGLALYERWQVVVAAMASVGVTVPMLPGGAS